MQATEKQIEYIKGLLEVRRAPADMDRKLTHDLSNLDKRSASYVISALLACPLKTAPAAHTAAFSSPPAPGPNRAWPTVREGRYAVEHEGTMKFYQVDRPKEGKWAGHIFVKVQASDDLHAIRNPQERSKIMDLIAIDPAAASRRYGQLIGSCSICGRTLTDETSRAHGIGPICREATGW